MNLAIFPFSKLGKRDTREIIEYEGWLTDSQGRRTKQQWKVEGLVSLGLPDEFDERVMVALLTIAGEQKFAERTTPLTIYKILNLMRLSTRTKQNYRYVLDALKKLVGVTIFTESSFYDNRLKRWISHTKGFHILETFELAQYQEGEEGQPIFQEGSIVWSEELWNSLRSGYIKPLDLENYFDKLKSATARKLYRLFDKALTGRDSYEIEVTELAQRIGMSPNYAFPSQILQKLRPALEELVREECILTWDSLTYRRQTYLRVSRVPEVREYQEILPRPEAQSALRVGEAEGEALLRFDRFSSAVKELYYYGFPLPIAQRLQDEYGEAYLLDKLRLLEQVYRVGALPRDPLQWLQTAITENLS